MSKVNMQSFADAEAALQAYIPIVKQMTGKDITLERMEPLMARLGNPQRNLRVIHVAGTSGKTSTAYYIAGILKAADKIVGLTVSPHIDVVSERLQVSLQPLPEAEFCRALTEFLNLIDGVEPLPSYFELLMAMAYWYFAKIGVDYAVIETGFGGLHDASNICQNADKVCVLTDIGIDHTHILGSTLPSISLQKAGIMHAGNKAFTCNQSREVLDVFTAYANRVGAELHIVDEVSAVSSCAKNPVFESLPLFQKRNWSLAHEVYQYLAQRDQLPELTIQQLEMSMHTYVPGRMDVQQVNGLQLIMDGAHNEQKMAAFVQSFQVGYPGKKVPVLLGLKEGKEYSAVLQLLRPITSKLIVTTFEINQDLRARPIDPSIIAKQALKDGFSDVIVEADTQRAHSLLLASHEDLAIVTGSFYLLANVRRLKLRT